MRCQHEEVSRLAAPDNNRHHTTHQQGPWKAFLLPLTGCLALIWVLLRVLPKPIRASYPCQRVAMPLAGGFLFWLAGMTGAVLIWRKGRRLWRESRFPAAIGCLAFALLIGSVGYMIQSDRPAFADPHPTNDPIGVAKGVHPGRVVWVFDPEATDWEGPGDGHWWEGDHTSQVVVDQMVSQAVLGLSGSATDAEAWDALFRHFNQVHGSGDVGYQAGERIVIKVNFVGCHYLWGSVDSETYELVNQLDYMNTSPQMILALLRQLVYEAGVNPADIYVGDSTALFPNQYYDICDVEFPDVHYLDHNGGNAAHPRTMEQFSTIPFFWSSHPIVTRQDYVPVSIAEATYLINLANLKSHRAAGVTMCGKNLFGSLIRWPAESGYFDMHPDLPQSIPDEGNYRPQVDFMGHAQTGGKTLLCLIDGLYSGVHDNDDAPRQWEAPPFNGDWTSSLFASQDLVAIESVAFDFLQIEGDPRNYPQRAGADDYMHEAAQADNPVSDTFYDPDHDGDVARLSSLGVHEHWNDPVHMEYSRNLGTGDGIELVKFVNATGVDLNLRTLGLRIENYPNPFSPQTTISFHLPKSQRVRLDILGVDGSKIATLADDHLPAGPQKVTWNGRDEAGQLVASGGYYSRLSAGGFVQTKMIMLVR
ncbi:DUF362 domain-containing protein [Candidatus Eisenbacteria bacterium]|uniref:DUF362 domain-containing protein n=1 Tax=Eiseniibacteriota bacterium TaxID=2212470 RepID=A0ABV6YKK6_UNCEI